MSTLSTTVTSLSEDLKLMFDRSTSIIEKVSRLENLPALADGARVQQSFLAVDDKINESTGKIERLGTRVGQVDSRVNDVASKVTALETESKKHDEKLDEIARLKLVVDGIGTAILNGFRDMSEGFRDMNKRLDSISINGRARAQNAFCVKGYSRLTKVCDDMGVFPAEFPATLSQFQTLDGMEVNHLCEFYGISEEDDNPKAALAHYIGLPGDWFPE